ncbi:MAG: FG-GAP repeat domain-containing protein, partial [Planctomycetota bacterium]
MKQAAGMLVVCVLLVAPGSLSGSLLNLGPEELVQASSANISVPGYSVPSYVDWNNDGLKDLVVGEGSGSAGDGKVRVYLNVGTSSSPQFSGFSYAQSGTEDLTVPASSSPQFSGFSYAQSGTEDLTVPASGCQGAFPRVVYWDSDARKDLLIGLANGTVKIFLNTGTDSAPAFDAGTTLQFGPSDSKTNIDIGSRATAMVVDWDNDGAKDLVAGAYDGKIHIFLNEGSDTAPDFVTEAFAQQNGSDLEVPPSTYGRSSPFILDLDEDGKKDLLTGNTDGQLLFYSNVNTDAAPTFSGYVFVQSDGSAIDLAGAARSRPFVCD